MNKILLLLFLAIALNMKSMGQGCVAIKSNGGYCSMLNHNDSTEQSHKWRININNRYFESYKHFVGSEEQKQRVELGTQVENYSNTTDLYFNRALQKGWSASLDMPVLFNHRSSLYEHGGKSRHSTKSYGLGDVRLALYDWIIAPSKMSKANLQIGVGIKLPTGDYKYQDNFYVNDSTTISAPVDQSIQLGDGGLGFTLELNGYVTILKNLNLYGNYYYLMNPREQNGTSTTRGSAPSAASIRYGTYVMSVPDQYMIRGGFNYQIHKLTITAGYRDECLPVFDLIGGSNGFRRPGFIESIEPGLTYEFKKLTVYAYVPYAIVRNRTKSLPDRKRSYNTGVDAHGDAAFADYAVNVGFVFKL